MNLNRAVVVIEETEAVIFWEYASCCFQTVASSNERKWLLLVFVIQQEL